MYQKPKIRIRHILATLVLTLTIGYFCYHAVSGERGLLALVHFDNRYEKAKNKLDELQAHRTELEQRVTNIQSQELDLDLLDEQARKLLGYGDAEEIVYFVEEGEAEIRID